MLKRDASPWGEGNFSGILPLQDGSPQAPQGRLLTKQHQPSLGSCFTFLRPQNHKFIKVFLLSLHPNTHVFIYTHATNVSFCWWHRKKPYDWCRSCTILSASNAMQISQSVISRPVIPMDEMMNSGRKVESSAWSEEPLLRWVGVCGGAMLINYSVWLCWDEKHSNQIHRSRGILQRDALQLVGMAMESCLPAQRKKERVSFFILKGDDQKNTSVHFS